MACTPRDGSARKRTEDAEAWDCRLGTATGAKSKLHTQGGPRRRPAGARARAGSADNRLTRLQSHGHAPHGARGVLPPVPSAGGDATGQKECQRVGEPKWERQRGTMSHIAFFFFLWYLEILRLQTRVFANIRIFDTEFGRFINPFISSFSHLLLAVRVLAAANSIADEHKARLRHVFREGQNGRALLRSL